MNLLTPQERKQAALLGRLCIMVALGILAVLAIYHAVANGGGYL